MLAIKPTSTHVVPSDSLGEEEGWCYVKSDEGLEEYTQAKRQEDRMSKISSVLETLAFIACTKAPSVSVGVAVMTSWTLLKPTVVQATVRCAEMLQTKLKG